AVSKLALRVRMETASKPPGARSRDGTMNQLCLSLSLALLILGHAPTLAQERPLSGNKVAGFEPLDRAILEMMDQIGCQAATVALSKDGRLLYSRGFGWSDAQKKKAVAPDALMRIASVSKPITAAMIKNAIRAGQLSLDTRAFPLIAIKPPGSKAA